MFLIVPPQVFFERLFRRRSGPAATLVLLAQRVFQFQPYPAATSAGTTCGSSSIYMSTCCCSCRCCCGGARAQDGRAPGAWLYALALPLGINEALLKPLFPESHNLVSDWYIFNHYLLLTLYGFVLASMRGAWDWFAARRQLSLGARAGRVRCRAAAVRNRRRSSATRRRTPSFANVFTWVWLMAFIGYGRRYLSSATAAALGARCELSGLHPAPDGDHRDRVLRDPAALDAWTKYGVVLVGTMAICVALYEGIRRFQPTRLCSA